MNAKRIFSFLLALVLLLGVFPAAAVTANAATGVNLTVWADEYSRDWIYQRAADFNAQSTKWKLNISFDACHVGESGNIILADPQGAADVFIYGNDMLGALVEADALLPITGSALTQVKADNSDTMIDSVTYTNGKVYGIPYTANTYFMYYNKNVFSASDVKNLNTMLKKGKVAIPLDNTWYLPAFYYANGCTMFGPNGTEAEYGIDFSCENGVTTTLFLNELAHHPNVRLGNQAYARELIDGNIDAFFSGTWEANTMKEAFGSNYGAVQLPTVTIDGKTCQLKAFAGSKAYGVNAYTKNPEAALAFAAFLGNTESQLQRYDFINDIPAATKLAGNTALKSDPAAVAQINTVANTSVMQPWIPEMSNYWNAASVLSNVIINNTFADEREAKAIMTEIGYVLNNGLVITAQPKSVTVASGKKASTSVEVIGNGLTYQWYIKNAGSSKFSKSSITSTTYSTTMSSSTDGRQVYCVITNRDGVSLRTKTATLKMSGEAAPAVTITTQPKTTYTKSGSTAKVTVAASGDDLKYQWYIKNASASSYSKSSVTSATYSTKMSSSSKDRRVYCVVTDKYGNSVKSNTVYLRMAATVTTQPKSVVVAKGETAKVSFKAAGDGLTYAWYYKDAGSDSFKKTTAFTGNSYSIEMTAARAGRQVYCKITDKYGKTATTDTVILSMEATITTQPKTTYTKLGSTAKVTVKAVGDGLKYQWYAKNAGASSYTKSSVTTATYSTTMRDAAKDRYVYCVVTDMYGNSVRTNTVILRMAATVTTQPQSVTVAKGETAKVSFKAVGDGLTYTWYYKDAGTTSFKKTSAFTGTSYKVEMTSARNGRQVYCKITDKYGKTVTTNTVTLKMK